MKTPLARRWMHAWTGRQSGAQPTQLYKWILDTSLDTKAHRRWWSRYSPPSIWPTVPREPSVQGGCFFTSRWTESNWEGCPTFADVAYFVAFWTDKVHLAALRSSIPRSSRKKARTGKNNASTRKDEITTYLYLSEMRHWGIRYSGLNASNSSDGNEMCKKRFCVSSTESWHESKRIRKQSETCFGEMFACQVFGKGAFARRNLTRKHRLLSRQTSFHSSNVEARWRVKAVWFRCFYAAVWQSFSSFWLGVTRPKTKLSIFVLEFRLPQQDFQSPNDVLIDLVQFRVTTSNPQTFWGRVNVLDCPSSTSQLLIPLIMFFIINLK